MKIAKFKLTDYQFLEVQESSNESNSLSVTYILKL